MGKNVILSEETLRDLLEAHASLSAWYYELWAALRAANATSGAPDDAARTAFVERLAADFPEVAAVARSIKVPRMYVPAPPALGGAVPVASAPAAEPAPVAEQATAAAPPEPPGPPPPPIVNPSAVKY